MATEKEPMAISVEAAAHRLSISRSLAWELVWAGQLPTLRLGRRRVVPVKVLEDMLANVGQIQEGESQ